MQDALNDALAIECGAVYSCLSIDQSIGVDSAGELETQECKCFRSPAVTNTEQSEQMPQGASKVANSESWPRAKIVLKDILDFKRDHGTLDQRGRTSRTRSLGTNPAPPTP